MNKEITNAELLEAIHILSSTNDEQFAKLRADIRDIKIDIRRIDGKIDYLDRKREDRFGDAVQLIRKEDERVDLLVDGLDDEEVITSNLASNIRNASPFIKPA